MAVLQRTPQKIVKDRTTDLSVIYPFEMFQKKLLELDNVLVSGGLLALQYTQYALEDTSVPDKYEVYGNSTYFSQIFDKNSKLVGNDIKRNCIYRKK